MVEKEIIPLLSICIPIYNRKQYLQMMLERFLEDKELFQNEIHLFISDNGSSDNLQGIANEYQAKGLTLEYNRNQENLGMDGNYVTCLKRSKGKYVWLLGSDDIPISGYIQNIVKALRGKDYGFMYLNCSDKKFDHVTEFRDSDQFLEVLSYWSTYISSSIVNSKLAHQFDYSKYMGSLFCFLPLFLSTIISSEVNAVFPSLQKEPQEDKTDPYNLFKIFIVNLHHIYLEYVGNGLIRRATFEKIKKEEYLIFISDHILKLYIFNENPSGFDKHGAAGIIWSNYWKYGYFYRSLAYFGYKYIRHTVKRIIRYHP